MTAGASDMALKTNDIRIRDPYIYAEAKSETYFMYASSPKSDFIGVQAYSSKDLVNWTAPQPVLTLPDDAGIQGVWAPEMHAYNGAFYLFATFLDRRFHSVEAPRPFFRVLRSERRRQSGSCWLLQGV